MEHFLWSRSLLAILFSLLSRYATSLMMYPQEPINSRKRKTCSSTSLSSAPGDGDSSSTANSSTRRRRRPSRRGASLPQSRQQRPGLSNMCPPLAGAVGAPELPVLTTKDPRIIERWLEEHVGSVSSGGHSILGFDTESIAKPPWKPERASLPDGPATVQLSTPTSCLIVQLSRCGDGSALHAPDIVREIVNNPRIIKVGVGIDDDALEMYRWSRKSYEDAPKGSYDRVQLWEMTSRFDIGCILPDSNPWRRVGIRELGQKILGVDIAKSKKLPMSNWGRRFLTMEQISYAARDAWVSAAIVERLQEGNGDAFHPDSIVEMDFIKRERKLDEMDKRARLRKAAKLELKEMKERQKCDEGANDDIDEERMQELYGLLDLYRPDQPPKFDEDAFTLTLY